MNYSNPAKDYLMNNSGGKMKSVGVVRIVEAALTLLGALLMFSNMGELFNTRYIDFSYSAGLWLLFIGTFLVICGMSIAWGAVSIRSCEPWEDGSLLRSAAAASLAASSIGFLFGLAFILIFMGALNTTASGSGMSAFAITGGWGTFTVINCFVGLAWLFPTALSRSSFYRSLQKSILSGSPRIRCAGLYGASKCINAIVRLCFIILLIHILSSAEAKLMPGNFTASFVFLVLALAAGIVSGILETVFAFEAGRVLYDSAYSLWNGYEGGYSDEDGTYGDPQQGAYPAQENPCAYTGEAKQEPVCFCPNCGAPAPGGILFCQSCGCKLDEE